MIHVSTRHTAPRYVVVVFSAVGLAIVLAGGARAAEPKCFGKAATIVGTGGRDELVGTKERDVIVGLGGRDQIEGRRGADLICGGGAADALFDEHTDRENDGFGPPGSAAKDFISAGGGNDRVFLSRGGDFVLGEAGDDVVVTLATPGSGPDEIEGGLGDDVLRENFGEDTLSGGRGSDLIFSGRDDDAVSGGPGRDTIDYQVRRIERPSAAITVNLTRGIGESREYGRDRLDEIESVEGTKFSDHIVGDDDGNRLYGGHGDDVIKARGGRDFIDGFVGYDRCSEGENVRRCEQMDTGAPLCLARRATIVGTMRDDRIEGTPRPDVIMGMSGNDSITGAQGADIICGSYGRDSIDGGPGNDRLAGQESFDSLGGGSDDDWLSLGFAGNIARRQRDQEIAQGNDGDDTLVGAAGPEWLLGGADNDELFGFDGDDVLDGGLGNNTANGGGGDDVCTRPDSSQGAQNCESS